MLTPIPCGSVAGCNVDNFLAGSSPNFVTVDPYGKFVYVTNAGTSNVSAYTIASTGALTYVGVTGVLASSPTSISVDPSGKFAYVTYGSGVWAYQIGSDGALTGIGSVSAGTNPVSVAVVSSGKFAYVVNNGSGDVSAYRINGGALTHILCTGNVSACNTSNNNFWAGTNPISVAVDPSGKFAYVANNGAGTGDVSAYTVTPSTGVLAQIPCVLSTGCSGSNFTAGTGPTSISVDPSGQFVYVANHTPGDISAYAVDASGALIPISCGSVPSVCNTDNYLAGAGANSITTTGKVQ
jgi:6-phosphogluconolactonase (cycloisomerase 2 family)